MNQPMVETNSSNEQTNSSPGQPSQKVNAVMIALLQQWPGAQIDDRDPAGVWSNAIDDLTNDQIAFAIRQLRNEVREFALNPAQFRAIAKQHQPHQQEVIKPIADLSEKEEARKAVRTRYGLRIAHCHPTHPSPYQGDFDVDGVAMAAKLPPEGYGHQAKLFWDELEREFDTAWSDYVS